MQERNVLLIRHAKSSWEDFRVKDADRPLNDRGKRDGPKMAARLAQARITIDRLYCSNALRARQTAAYFQQVLGLPAEALLEVPELYLAEPPVYQSLIQSAPDELKTLAFIAHNPGITNFANSFGVARIDNIPTTGIFAVSAAAASWADFLPANKRLLFFDYPKNL